MNAERGFTLLELIVTVVVASILLTVAVPSFTTLIRSNRAASEANALLTMLTLARSEAIKRNAAVVLCRSTSGTACASGSGDWNSGVMVYVDQDGDGAYNNSDVIVQAAIPLSAVSSITFNAGSWLNFNPNGSTNKFGSFTITPANDTNYTRKVVLSPTGRPRICDPAKDATCT
ncbi:MAG: GspH/FimT family pseudopilin [Nevskiales bacterium]|nr:GspH/FimT family pseudopilin [Nevskiales bacterium]